MNELRPDQASAQSAVGRFLFDHTVVVLALLVIATMLSLFLYLNALQNQLVAALAEQGTRLQSETLEELRGLYTTEVVEKVRSHGISVTHDYQGKDNAIPLPATLTIEMGRRIGERGSGMNVRLYSEYPFPWRKEEGGPRDAFGRDALAALSRDPAHAFSRVEDYEGQSVIRYAVADRMRAACIACHNSHPASPKTDWKEGDVRGVLEVTRPISSFAAAARSGQRQAFGLMVAMATVGLAGVALVFGKQRLNARKLSEEIDERKRAEAELMASAARLSAMDEASPLGTFVTDGQGCCVHVNSTYQKIAGHSAQAMKGALWSVGIHPEDRGRVLTGWQGSLERGDTFAVECRLLRGDGSTTWVSCKVAAMKSGGQHLGYVGTLEDISERKKVERMKNEFVSTVSHELRTPLTSIMGSLGLLAGGVSGEISGQAKTLVDIARKNSERLVRLINDILDIEKIESGSMHFNLQPQDLQPLVEQAVAANHAYAAQLGVSFAVAAPLPGAQARVDADAMMQVLTNLMSNAAKFSPAGAAVELRLVRDGGMIRLSVTDHGPGIPESFRAKIFEKFSQADASDSRQKGGTGLGLSISKAIVEKMGGSIGFVSREGEGTTFHVDLPEWVEPRPAAAGVDSAAPHRPRVLVCEDDHDVAALLCMMLGQAGYDTVPAYDAASARRLLSEGTFAAVTLDLHLPDVDGRAFLRELRENPATRDQFIVVVSGHLRASPRANEGDGLGVVDWLAKPIDQDRLLDAIRRGTRSANDGKCRVLHVEDDADVRQVVAALCAEVAEFEGAASFREAAQWLSNRHYDLVILDLELPDRSGWDLLTLIDQQTPPPPVLVFSGSELSSAESGRVAAALVKSHVSNPELLGAILALTSRPNGLLLKST